jgi:hypothetical protein
VTVLILPDLHHHVENAEHWLRTQPFDHAIFLGDFFDDFNDNVSEAGRTGDIIFADTLTFHDAGSLSSTDMVQGKLDGDGHLTTTKWFSPTRAKVIPFTFTDSPDLIALAEKLAATYKPQEITLDGATYKPVIRKGSVVTGDLSGVTEAEIADIRAKLDPDLMEMESAAFAQVASSSTFRTWSSAAAATKQRRGTTTIICG